MIRPWTPAEEAVLRDLYPTMNNPAIGERLGRSESAILNRAQKLGLNKPPGFKNAGCFARGVIPWNKGTHWQAGGASIATRFQPGTRQGVALKLYQPIGSERISKDGYLQRKVNDDMPLQRRWRAVHILIWEAINGPLPKGHAIVFRDGDKTHLVEANLEMVSRAELMRRNSFHRYGKEIAAVIQLKGAITRQINRRTAHVEQHQQPA